MRPTRIYIILAFLIALFYSCSPRQWPISEEKAREITSNLEAKIDTAIKETENDVTNMLVADSARIHFSDSLPEPGKRVFPDSLRTFNNDSLSLGTTNPIKEQIGDSSILEIDSIHNTPDTISRFIRKKVDLDNEVDFQAKDSLVLEGRNSAFLFGESKVTYGDINLTASKIRMDMQSNIVYAEGTTDSIGEPTGTPVFKDGSGEYASKTMKYNFKSKKGFISDVVTQQGEGYLTGGKTKKMENDEYYITGGRYTTCDDHENPHFYFNITQGKVKPKKNIVTGPVYMVLADVPLPLALPFGYFPFTSEYSSGIIVPTFGDDYQKGFYLREGGYYFAINDNIDLALTGEIYTRGSWGINAQSTYIKRYKFNGNFNLSYITTITGDKGEADYSKGTNFRIGWTHTQDTKANPNMTFSASVNFATSGYSRNDLSSYYSNDFTENTKSSTINMTYRIPNSKWSLSTTANISQRTADSTLTVSFPNITISMSQIAPFKRKRAVGDEKWYEKIKMSYSGVFQNQLTAKQDEFFKKSLIKDWRNGMRHTIPISATFNIFKYLNVTPNITLNDRMYTSKIRRQWDPAASVEVQDTTYNFYNIFDFSGGISFDTKIYGFFKPMKFLGDKVQMIRHVITPTVSFSATPDFSAPGWGYYGSYAYTDKNTGEVRTRKYSYFQHGMFGAPGQGKSGIVSYSLANNLEMKVKSDSDTTGVKKVSLIENFTVNQSYNFAADSLNWSNINTSILLRLTKSFNLNLNATWDVYTYQLNSSGNPVRVNRTRLAAGKGLGKLSSTGTSFSYTFNNATFQKKNNNNTNNTTDKESNKDTNKQNQGNKSENSLDSDGYAHWEFPWSLSVNYSVNYSYGSFNKKKLEYNGKWTQNLSFSGNVRPTKNWSFNFSASYNFDTKKIAYMNCSISRDLHCFSMSASFVPVGPYKSYNFHIAVKSSMLSDLKYDKRSDYNGVDWY